MAELDARVPCTSEMRDKLRALKTDNERYEDVLRQLVEDHEENA
jgi:SOS response regulatory protein OraA/RecX